MNKPQTKKTKSANNLTLDTHLEVKNIATKGIKAEAAEAIVNSMRNIAEASRKDLVTQGDLQEFKTDMRQEFTDFKHEMRQEFKDFTHEIRQEIQRSSYEQKLYANRMMAAVIIGAPTFYAGLEFLMKFFAQ